MGKHKVKMICRCTHPIDALGIFKQENTRQNKNALERYHTSLLSITNLQFGQLFDGLLFQLTFPASIAADALLILVAILLGSTNHDGLHVSKNKAIIDCLVNKIRTQDSFDNNSTRKIYKASINHLRP